MSRLIYSGFLSPSPDSESTLGSGRRARPRHSGSGKTSLTPGSAVLTRLVETSVEIASQPGRGDQRPVRETRPAAHRGLAPRGNLTENSQ